METQQHRQPPIVAVVPTPPPVADDRDVAAALAEVHRSHAETLRATADMLTTRFPGNAYADRESAALRQDADLLLRSAQALARRYRVELPTPLRQVM